MSGNASTAHRADCARTNFRPATLLALLAGAVHAQSFAPLNAWWLQLLSLALLAALLQCAGSPRRAAWLGWLFGFGWFASGIWWLYISMHDYGGMPAPMAAFAVVVLSTYLALYPALACALTARLVQARGPRPVASLWVGALAFAASLTLAEWLRGWMLTGFPWLAAGYAHSDGPLAGFAPLLGVYGIAGIGAGLAWLLAGLVARTRLPARRPAADISPTSALKLWSAPLVLIAVLAMGQGLRAIRYVEPQPTALNVRLLQGNVPQNLKFEPGQLLEALALYRRQIVAQPADLTITPETAFPLLFQQLPPPLLQELMAFSDQSGTHLLLGSVGRLDNGQYVNSAFGIRPAANGAARLDYRYDKHHLVPFGEFVPWGFRWFVDMMRIPLGDFARGQATPPPFAVRGQGVAINICYEDLFGEEIARSVRDAPQPVNVLANVTNLAWFGDTVALDQHLQIARMRALETQRPMLRATNTGVTAVIDATGRVQSQLPVWSEGALQARVVGTRGFTPYVRLGNWPAVTVAALGLMMIGWRRGRRRAETTNL